MADIFIAPHKQNEKPQTTIALTPARPIAKPKETSFQPHLFTSFCPNPEGVTFDTQEDSETVLLFLRRHFITNIPWIFATIILLLLPPFIFGVLRISETVFPFPHLPGVSMILILFYYFSVITIAFVYFITWFYNISLVTTIRVLDVDFSGLVYKNVAATKLTLVEDVSFIQVGAIASVFDYGNVLVQTAGTIDNFDFSSVPQPERVVQIIEGYIGQATGGKHD